MKSLSASHIATLCKYMGTSFVAGAVAHGSFSETRSAMTAAIGVAAYVVGSFIQVQLDSRKSHSWGKVLVAGAIAAIGIGFFTGGLQHFPDSPFRSVWVVPLGYLLSWSGLLLLARAEDPQTRTRGKKVYLQMAAGFAVVVGSCVGMLSYLSQDGKIGADGHDHHAEHHDDHHSNHDNEQPDGHHDDHHGESH